ncbi:MAG: HDIG domain-containing metalloprotein [Candidatus Omnitrophota bacterium]
MKKNAALSEVRNMIMKNGFRKKDVEFFNTVSKAVISSLFFLFAITVIFTGMQPYFTKTQEGDISLTTVYAPFDFTYPGDVDEEKMKVARENAAHGVTPVYNVDHSAKEAAIKDSGILFDSLSSVQNIEGEDLKSSVERVKSSLPISLSDETLGTLLAEKDVVSLKNGLVKIMDSAYASYIIDGEVKKKLDELKKSQINILDVKRIEEKSVGLSNIGNTGNAKRYKSEIDLIAGNDYKKKSAVSEVLIKIMKPNLVFAEEETKARREEAARSVPLVLKKLTTKKNEIIIRKGQRVTRTHIVQLNQLNRMQGLTNIASYLMGVALLLVILIVIFAYYMKLTEPKILETPKDMTLIALIALVSITIFKIVSAFPLPSYIVPFSVSTMLVAILVSTNAGAIVGLLLSILTGIMFGGRLEVVLVCLIGGLVGIYATKNLRRRFQIAVAGIAVGVANAIVIISLGLVNNLKPMAFFSDSLWGIANGILSCFIVMGLLPVLEHLFKITTNITLLELSDLNHPLLKEITLSAPGTYHHSLLVGNLAEAACKEIGANSLLARIGAYYHDIGKIEKSEYFSENEASFKSRHDNLAPSMSSLIIVNHVKEGVELAKKHNLNKPIIDIIQQHHGTGLMYFFYKKALDASNGDKQLKEDEYRYPGPKPQTKEAAVVLLADSVEASSRTISEPTPGKIRNLVQRIINNKFIDKQLDESDLTLRDLYKISESFVRVLIAAFHVRTEYPAKEEENRLVVNGQDNKS